ncbi:MAG: dihydrolipoyl dehydrogenase [Zetaproteobacteria bacterium CG_4_9_14_3_um_filter_49_83]|nr:MAG: dihydrolipoyl dehydrogenase [Zetaproteobacteria bacterium CG1_02_49_23]PIQ30211.1 MAG: dihydrolipoyl dehydrogenase [Zetaproteobacteria bacterium CG17_big_fil_post_rev_8_21_14_2_50_50_13]PIV30994.1 MAG: dihydrolipoyl dehydrogenase [Zetaproteobacteria bacterium CG02_land_8_20_14_3_00_50_9]PIY55154.1 MAG: dihydrolipoyl dehydrogenase [Zetaproteobacteria bacterium CG_4_10_14_0_8_um_filter_49_80]PJA35104.1 MAG: dihydrolipoyl dehydrogenase [Zetaproteobacteria bacterium CG_4_9_14_3_um_filter_49
MPIDVFMTQLSPTMTEGKIARWLKKEGDELVSGEVMAEIETDKATMEMEVIDEGVLHKIIAGEGAIVPVGAPIAVIAEEDEEIPDDYLPEGACEVAAEAAPVATPEEVVQHIAAAQASAPADTHELQLKAAGVFNADGDYDVVVIGAGPGGYVAAIRAAQLGLKVACVESTHLGGICLNWGCIPTKALLRTAELINVIRHSGDELGLGISEVKPDLAKAVARSRKISARLNGGIGFLFKKNKVTHIEGFATFEADNRLMVKDAEGNSTQVTAKHVIVATGARARAFPGMDVDHDVIITYKQALAPKALPKDLVVIGSGAIGMEFAYFYKAMGSNVTVIEAAPQILPLEDEEISKVVARSFKKNGIKIITGAMVSSAKNVDGRAVVEYNINGNTQSIEGDVCLVAVGVIGNTDAIGADNTAMKVERNQIEVDDYYRTDHPGVYAIGDVVGAPALAHVASHEGIVCVEAIAGQTPHPVDYGNVPGCTYCQPQVGSCGMTEKAAKEAGHNVKVGRMSYATNGKAMGLAETEGMVKTIFDADSGELLGAHIVGAEATELIVSLQLARTLETTESELIHHMFPHPTLSEMIHESVLDSEGKAIHI